MKFPRIRQHKDSKLYVLFLVSLAFFSLLLVFLEFTEGNKVVQSNKFISTSKQPDLEIKNELNSFPFASSNQEETLSDPFNSFFLNITKKRHRSNPLPTNEAQRLRFLKRDNDIVNAVGGKSHGGLYDGRKMKIRHDIKKFPKPPNVPLYRNFEEDSEQPHLLYNKWTMYLWPLVVHLGKLGWKYAETEEDIKNVHLWFTRRLVPQDLKEGYQMINSIGRCDCLGGTKAQQLSCRREYADFLGCSFDSLKVQPIQFDMNIEKDCARFFERAKLPENSHFVYLKKPTTTFHGDGMKLFYGLSNDLTKEFGDCSKPSPIVLQDYVSNTATMNGYKYDLRSFMLVASLKPQLVFHHDGIVRRSDVKYHVNEPSFNAHIMNSRNQTLGEHFFSFEQAAESLHTEHGLPKDHFEKSVRKRMKEVSKFVYLAELFKFRTNRRRRVGGRFHLFALDWAIDSNGKVYLLEGNRFPHLSAYPKHLKLTPMIYNTMIELVILIHTRPDTLPQLDEFTVEAGYKYEGWEMIYNEFEDWYEEVNKRGVNMCSSLANY